MEASDIRHGAYAVAALGSAHEKRQGRGKAEALRKKWQNGALRQLGAVPSVGFWESRLLIKKSRFVVRLGPCTTLDDAKSFRQEPSSLSQFLCYSFPESGRSSVSDLKANHNCWAARSRGLAVFLVLKCFAA